MCKPLNLNRLPLTWAMQEPVRSQCHSGPMHPRLDAAGEPRHPAAGQLHGTQHPGQRARHLEPCGGWRTGAAALAAYHGVWGCCLAGHSTVQLVAHELGRAVDCCSIAGRLSGHWRAVAQSVLHGKVQPPATAVCIAHWFAAPHVTTCVYVCLPAPPDLAQLQQPWCSNTYVCSTVLICRLHLPAALKCL